MSRLESFIKNLCGKFNNQAQIKKEESEGEIIHPKAKHINAVCNQKIKNLPQNFKGYFVIEESYYETEKGKKILPHLFLFTLDKENNVVLTRPACILLCNFAILNPMTSRYSILCTFPLPRCKNLLNPRSCFNTPNAPST